MEENVNHPKHYNANNGIECIDAMIAAFGEEEVSHFCKINAFKYIWRAEHKGHFIQDMEKAQWYLDKCIEMHKQAPINTQID